jgi:hypothetical protein
VEEATRWRHVKAIAIVPLDDRVVLLKLTGMTAETVPFALEDTAAAVWHAVNGRRTAEQIAEVVTRGFGGDRDAMSHDVHAFLIGLAGGGLIEPVGR